MTEEQADAKRSTVDAIQAVLDNDVIFLSDGETTLMSKSVWQKSRSRRS
ncbi:hypothetical protein HB780_20995 [Rhizobium lusitanum]|nr:hypothetical protein [Rhizobium lusitanum]QND48116.1 hypothetical protein HB780_20995 [Rhizobium lusitanum]